MIFTPNTSNASSYEKRGFEVIRYPAFFLTSNWPFPKFWRLDFWKKFFSLYSMDVDVVMTRTRFFFNSFMGAFFAKFRFSRKRLIHVEHGSDFVNVSSKFVTWSSYFYDMTLGRFVFFLSNDVVSISRSSYRFVDKHFRKRPYLIRRGVDFSSIDGVEPESLDSVSIVFVGRLYKWKGVDNIISAFSKCSNYSNANLYIAGYGEDEEKIKKMCSKFDRVHFLGKVSFSRSASLMKGADIYVHGSYPGGALSSSLLQAMYCSCCVVASPNEGADEVVDESNGILLKSNSVKELSKGLDKVISNKKLRKSLGSKAHEDIKEKFNWDRVIDKYEELLKK